MMMINNFYTTLYWQFHSQQKEERSMELDYTGHNYRATVVNFANKISAGNVDTTAVIAKESE